MTQISRKTTMLSSGLSNNGGHRALAFLVLIGLLIFLWLVPQDGHLPASPILAIGTKNIGAAGSGKPAENFACSTDCVIDILSIASKNRPELVETQKKTLASHVSVRNFFVATEDDDDDSDCGNHITPDDALEISKFCRFTRYFDPDTQSTMDQMQHFFAKPKVLKEKGEVAGKWLCAQKRPIFGLDKALKSYHHKTNNSDNLPDYLILMDDDTYFNMQLFPSYMTDNTPDVPRVTPGCLLRFKHAKLTTPYGGFSTIFNKASLAFMMKPRHCPQDSDFCNIVESNQAGERHMFQNGMSLIDLMRAYAATYPFREYKSWNSTGGYCMHSDWAIGYFINFYQASRQAPELMLNSTDDGRQDPRDRLEAWHGSWGYSHLGHGFCTKDGDNLCPPKSLVCHYISPNRMVELYKLVKAEHPDRFRD